MRARLGGCPMRLLLIILAMLFVAPVAAQTSSTACLMSPE